MFFFTELRGIEVLDRLYDYLFFKLFLGRFRGLNSDQVVQSLNLSLLPGLSNVESFVKELSFEFRSFVFIILR
jgi:hypothetical protein